MILGTETPCPSGQGSEGKSSALGADRLADGVILMLGLTVVQRMVGFCRGVLFCRWLPAEELGQWDLAFSFLLVAAPLAVLGMPGSFGRYVEHFRQRDQLRTFLRRTTMVSLLCGSLGVCVLLMARDWFAWLVFDSEQRATTIAMLGISLLAVISFNFLAELFTALRQMRVASCMLFANSLAFALLGTGLLVFWQTTATAIIVAYGSACLITSLGAMVVFGRIWRAIPSREIATPHSQFWSKLMPFAGWIWMTNLAANLFEVADRYMIVHFGGFETHVAAGMVGNYHSSRVVPMLMVSVAGMIAGTVLPHLSYDWEQGRRQSVSERMNLTMKLTGLAMMAGSVAILAAAPLLFGWIFAGKYDGGLAILPWTLTYCVWLGMSCVAMNYIWCAERAKLVCFAYLPGLAINVICNLCLLPRFGLTGAALGTAAGNATSLLILCLTNRAIGLHQDRAVWFVMGLPLALCCGTAGAALILFAAVWAAFRGTWILSPLEKQELISTYDHYFDKFRQRFTIRTPEPINP